MLICIDEDYIFNVFQKIEVEEEHVDERSVEDLLTYINGGDRGTAGVPCFYAKIAYMFVLN